MGGEGESEEVDDAPWQEVLEGSRPGHLCLGALSDSKLVQTE